MIKFERYELIYKEKKYDNFLAQKIAKHFYYARIKRKPIIKLCKEVEINRMIQ
ncbi:Uncharacterised protein [Staphylococcus carnosus]|nr:hypothetical protein SCA04_19300 [Staphylococcus carnosus]SUL89181.1 Uncharacterised protein [Staphylococcus carnosus]